MHNSKRSAEDFVVIVISKTWADVKITPLPRNDLHQRKQMRISGTTTTANRQSAIEKITPQPSLPLNTRSGQCLMVTATAETCTRQVVSRQTSHS
jgi:hypothetical protein